MSQDCGRRVVGRLVWLLGNAYPHSQGSSRYLVQTRTLTKTKKISHASWDCGQVQHQIRYHARRLPAANVERSRNVVCMSRTKAFLARDVARKASSVISRFLERRRTRVGRKRARRRRIWRHVTRKDTLIT